jgi:2-dehydro-3-deoxyphosphogluconate aldolase/(4S)-4-hydroxy-2-oxoglutarate aldolase
MTKEQVRQQILDVGILPVVRVSSSQLAITATEAVFAGGIPIIEVTMTVPNAIDVIAHLALALGNEVTVGAGTVLDAVTARRCIAAGAQFLVSPVFDAPTVKLANREHRLMIAGALTPTEIVAAWNGGSDLVKVFPCGNVGGPKYIKALKAPLPHVPLIPTGGVSLATAAAFIRAGASALGIGTELISESALASGDVIQITRTAQEFVAIVRDARQSAEVVRSADVKGND